MPEAHAAACERSGVARWTFGAALALIGLALPPLALALFGLLLWRRIRPLLPTQATHAG